MNGAIDVRAPDMELAELAARADQLAVEMNAVETRRRQLRACQRDDDLPMISSHDGSQTLQRSVLNEARAPWRDIALAPCSIPNCLSAAGAQYFRYLGAFYEGRGAVIDIGPWLGASTFYLLGGLLPNPRFQGRKLHVVDDFVWCSSWMDHVYFKAGGSPADTPWNGGSSRSLFDAYTRSFGEHLLVEERRTSPLLENAHLPPLAWNGGPIELCVVACGRSIEANATWYRTFLPSFLPGRTLIVMQGWQVHKDVPVQWYNQTKQFTDGKESALDLIHEVGGSGIATFLYRG